MSVWTRRAHEICGLDLGIPSASRAEESAGSRSSRLIWIVCAPTVSGPLCVSVSIGPNANSMSLEPPEQLCLIFFGSESGSSEKLVLESLPSLEMAKSPSIGISGSWSSAFSTDCDRGQPGNIFALRGFRLMSAQSTQVLLWKFFASAEKRPSFLAPLIQL